MDSLYLAVMGAALDPILLERFASRKEGMTRRRAEAVRVADPTAFVDERSPVKIGDEEFVFGWGKRSYSYSLTNDDMLVLVAHCERPKPTFPTLYIQLRAVALWAAGVEGLPEVIERVRRLVAAMAPADAANRLPRLEQILPSRLDLAVDTQGSSFTRDEVEACVTRAAKHRDFHLNEDHADGLVASDPDDGDDESDRSDYFGRGSRYTGSVFGKGDVMVRLYNKTHQTKEKGIEWMHVVWEQCPQFDPQKEVWRVESQLRREALKQLGMKTMADLLRKGALAKVWGYMTGGPTGVGLPGQNAGPWLSMRLPDNNNTTRRTVDPRWQTIASCDFKQGKESPAVRTKSHATSAEKMAQMMAGCLSKFAALSGAYVEDGAGRLDPDATWDTALDAVAGGMMRALARKRSPDEPIADRRAAEVYDDGVAEFAESVATKRAEHAAVRRACRPTPGASTPPPAPPAPTGAMPGPSVTASPPMPTASTPPTATTPTAPTISMPVPSVTACPPAPSDSTPTPATASISSSSRAPSPCRTTPTSTPTAASRAERASLIREAHVFWRSMGLDPDPEDHDE